jgi:hypothetical protein
LIVGKGLDVLIRRPPFLRRWRRDVNGGALSDFGGFLGQSGEGEEPLNAAVFAVLFPTWIPFCSSSSSELVPNNSEFDLNTNGLQK